MMQVSREGDELKATNNIPKAISKLWIMLTYKVFLLIFVKSINHHIKKSQWNKVQSQQHNNQTSY